MGLEETEIYVDIFCFSNLERSLFDTTEQITLVHEIKEIIKIFVI